MEEKSTVDQVSLAAEKRLKTSPLVTMEAKKVRELGVDVTGEKMY